MYSIFLNHNTSFSVLEFTELLSLSMFRFDDYRKTEACSLIIFQETPTLKVGGLWLGDMLYVVLTEFLNLWNFNFSFSQNYKVTSEFREANSRIVVVHVTKEGTYSAFNATFHPDSANLQFPLKWKAKPHTSEIHTHKNYVKRFHIFLSEIKLTYLFCTQFHYERKFVTLILPYVVRY